MNLSIFYNIAVLLILFSACKKDVESKKTPNIILIVADDMGYSDLGCYGSTRIQTPVLDSIAYNGIRFMQFYNGSKCCPTRASMLTGLYPHQVGVGGMAASHDIPPPVNPGPYQGYLNNQCVTIAEILKKAGYSTYMAGKWHIGENRPHWPIDRGFDKYFGLISGASNFFDITKVMWEGVERKMAINDEQYYPPKDSFYMTDAITDYTIRFLEEHDSTDPFFLHVAYTAPHYPLHAWDEDIEKYTGKFSIGWDSIRNERYQRMIELGILNKNSALSPRDSDVIPWEQIENKEDMELKMEVYAAMIDRMDQGIGKIIQQLKKMGETENTLIMFLSDNGASSTGGLYGFDLRNNGISCGSEDSYMSYGKGWANASNTPFRYHKGSIYKGGVCTPFIAHWPSRIKKGTITSQPGYIIDIMQTCCELAKIKYPTSFKDNNIIPTMGKSLLPIFFGDTRESPNNFFWEHLGNKGVISGDYKLVSNYDNPWELYNLQKDLTERNDLSNEFNRKVVFLDSLYEQWAEDVGVYEYPNRDSIYNSLFKNE